MKWRLVRGRKQGPGLGVTSKGSPQCSPSISQASGEHNSHDLQPPRTVMNASHSRSKTYLEHYDLFYLFFSSWGKELNSMVLGVNFVNECHL